MVQPFDCVVLDDLMAESSDSPIVTQLFTQIVHHRPCTVFCITQNLFLEGKETRTRSLNAQYLVLFKNPRDKTQAANLARQMFPGESGVLIRAFHDATRLPYGYILIDLHQATADTLRLRTHCIPTKAEPHIVYYEPVVKT